MMYEKMLRLQAKFNQVLDAGWPFAPTVERDDVAAMVEEFGEFIGHTGYHWWKNTEMNERQALMELVDIWHFMMSFHMEHFANEEHGDLDALVEALASTYEHEWANKQEQASSMSVRDLQFNLGAWLNSVALDVEECLEPALLSLFALLQKLGVSEEKFFAMYVGKNALNHFRQQNGYKQGTYRKVWADGREDNEHMFDIIDTKAEDIAESDEPLEFVCELLNAAYTA